MRFRFVPLAGLALALSLAPAMAQPAPLERNVKAQSGRDVRVGVFAAIRSDCSSGPLPTVRLKDKPANGTIVVKQGKLRATNLPQCLAAEVPAFVAIYRSSPDFAGTDQLTLEIVAANGRIQLQRIQVTVEKPPVGQSL